MDSRRPLVWMILFGIVRAALIYVGAKLEEWNMIDGSTRERLISDGAAQVVGYLLVFVGIGWSALQKTQVWGRVRTALHPDSNTTPSEALTASSGPDMPI